MKTKIKKILEEVKTSILNNLNSNFKKFGELTIGRNQINDAGFWFDEIQHLVTEIANKYNISFKDASNIYTKAWNDAFDEYERPKYTNESNLTLLNDYQFRNVNFVLWCRYWLCLTDEKLTEFEKNGLNEDEKLFQQLKLILSLDGYDLHVNDFETAVDLIMLNFERYCMWARANGKHCLSMDGFYYKVKCYAKQKNSFFSSVVKAIREFYVLCCDDFPMPLKELFDKKLYKLGFSCKHKQGETYAEMNRRYLKKIKI